MRAVRIFVSSLDSYGEWESCILRDLDSLRLHCKSNKLKSQAMIVHIGFENILISHLAAIEYKIPNIVFVTESARWCLSSHIQSYETKIHIENCQPIYAVLSGLGYVETGEQLFAWIDSQKSRQTINEYEYYRDQLPTVPENSIEQLVAILPSDVMKQPINVLNLSVRSTNVVNRESIKLIQDFQRFTDEEIISLKNLGWKSFNEIRSGILDLSLKILSEHGFEVKNSHNQSAQTSSSTHHIRSSQKADLTNTATNFNLEGIFNPREYHILKARASDETYQHISEQLGLTRERVRQILQKALNKIASDYSFKSLEKHVKDLIAERETPLPVSGLNVLADTYLCCTDTNLLSFIFNEIDESPIYTIELYGEKYFSRISQRQYDATINQTIDIINSTSKSQPISKAWIKHYVFSGSQTRGQEFNDFILREILDEFEFTISSDDNESYVIGKHGVKSKIHAILAQSPIPLHYTEIHSQYVEHWGSVSINSIHATALKIDGIVIFKKGTFGLPKHFKVSDTVILEISEIIIPHITEAPRKQWHSAEMYQYLVDINYPRIADIDIYSLTEILKRSNHLTYLGRHVFQLISDGTKETSRIQVFQAVEALLIYSGKPLSSDEIKNSISADRGFGVIFQVMPTDKVIKISDKLWGLFDRDTGLSENCMQKYVEVVRVYLEVKQQGIHISELNPLFTSHGLDEINSTLAVSICQRLDPGIKISPSEYLFLAQWGNQRRKSPTEAIREVFITRKRPLSTKEIHLYTTQVLGRYLPQERLYGPMTALGVKYDESTALWTFSNESDEYSEEE